VAGGVVFTIEALRNEGYLTVQSDAELIERALAGDDRAFEVLVTRYERPVRATAVHVVKDRHLVSDVAQESFLRAYRQLGRLQRPAAFGAWLLRITHRCALDALRRRPDEVPLALDESRRPAPEERDGQLEEDHQQLLVAVMQLPAAERQVVLLRYFSNHTVREVAAIAGRSVGTVTKQLWRAHRRLRHMIEEP
jgi:RNA polymerase sigma-70 factor (ECF subfamily)